MKEGRNGFGMCFIGHLIYIGGGEDEAHSHNLSQCESFNVISNKWTDISPLPDQYIYSMTFQAVKKRFIYSFGGVNIDFKSPPQNMERILRLDILRPKWQSIQIKNPTAYNGCTYGVFGLGFQGEDYD